MGLALKRATEQSVQTATAKAEIAIEKILKNLERATMQQVSRVVVDTESHQTLSVEIYLRKGA